MFMGEFQHSLDDKARLTLPAKFRDGLGESFVITRGLDRCLFIYPRKDWEVLSEKLRALPLTRSDARQFLRLFFSGAADCDLDRQGRTVVPANLREYAGITQECSVIGVGNRVEVWDVGVWKTYSDQAAESFGDVAAGLVDLDL